MNKKLTAIGGLAALAVVGGTWAFFTQDTTIHNKLTTDGMYGLNTTEKFNPGSEWAPGTEVEKKITVKNTGTGAVLVRVKMDENWAYKEAPDKLFGEWASGQTEFTNIQLDDPADGDPTDDPSSVVHKNLADNIQTETTAKVDKWYLAEDGYWYFCNKLEGGKVTVDLLNSITLDQNTDMGLISDAYYYADVKKDENGKTEQPEFPWKGEAEKNPWKLMLTATTDEEKKEAADKAQQILAEKAEGKTEYDFYMTVETKTDDEKKGYSDAGYTLNITTEAVQATPEAVAAEWTTAPAELMENILK